MAGKLERASISLVGSFLLFLLLCSNIAGTAFAAKINVGGPVNWTFGFNYTDWALKSAPFYVNDTLGESLIIIINIINKIFFSHLIFNNGLIIVHLNI